MADGEAWSANGMTGAHQTLQLPAIVSVRDLLNGRIVRIRLTDRGPADPGRIIALSPKVADLLGMTADTPVEVTEDEAASRSLAEGLGKPPAQNISAAPVGEVRETSLVTGLHGCTGTTRPRRRPPSPWGRCPRPGCRAVRGHRGCMS